MFKLYSFKSVNDRRENKGEISLVCIIIKKNTVDINAKLLIWNWGYVNGYEWEIISTKVQETRCKNSMINVKLGLFH